MFEMQAWTIRHECDSQTQDWKSSINATPFNGVNSLRREDHGMRTLIFNKFTSSRPSRTKHHAQLSMNNQRSR